MATQPDQLVDVALADVVIDTNVRRHVVLDKSFVSSIRNYGILQPPVGWRDDAGKVHVTIGQRRTLAAREIGIDPLPIIIKTQQDAEQARIVAQLAENEQRRGLDPSDTAHAYSQLAFEFGVTTEQIARKTNSPKAKVQTALAVAGSETAIAAVNAHPITLEQASIYVEFDGDEEAIARLDAAAENDPAQLIHEAERIRQDKAFAAKVIELEQQIVDSGAEILDKPIYELRDVEYIQYLWPTTDDTRTRLTPETASNYTGFVGKVSKAYDGPEIAWGIRGWRAQGLTNSSSGTPSGGPLSDEDKAERKRKRQDKNDMRAATIVRRQWITTDLLREVDAKFITGDALLWITHAAFASEQVLGYSQRQDKARMLAAEWLGIETTDNGYNQTTARRALTDALVGNSRIAARLLLAYSVALAEEAAGDDKHLWFAESTEFAPYFEQLAAWGYTLSEIEQRIVTNANQKGTSK